jgi:hypothetical protein
MYTTEEEIRQLIEKNKREINGLTPYQARNRNKITVIYTNGIPKTMIKP